MPNLFINKRIYNFTYNEVKRVVLVLGYEQNNIKCWDFTREGYRRFDVAKIQIPIDVTHCAVITSNLNRSFESENVLTHIEDGVLYAVDFEERTT